MEGIVDGIALDIQVGHYKIRILLLDLDLLGEILLVRHGGESAHHTRVC